MRVKPDQNPGIPASAPESEAKITDGTSNTIMFAESSKAKTPFANDSFETTPQAMHVELMFDTLHREPVGKTSEQQVKSPKDQASGQFMDYTDDSCVSDHRNSRSEELKSKSDENSSKKYTMFLPDGTP
ncbi:DUF1559 domain-containing protein [bacterium]|nr:DUF1559 domain-containing protein [bacterium]